MSQQREAPINSLPFELFKELVDRSAALHAHKDTIAHGDEPFDAIRSAIGSNDPVIRRHLRDLQSELIVRHQCLGESLLPYIYVVQDFLDALSKPCPPGNPDWALAIDLSVKNESLLWLQPPDTFPLVDRRAVAMAEAANILIQAGYAVEMGPVPRLTAEVETEVQNEIESICKALGGTNLIGNILNNLHESYDHRLERYRSDTMSKLPSGLMIPWGFLLQYAVKYFALEPPKVDDANHKWHRLLNLSTALLQLEDFRIFSVLSVLLQDVTGVVSFLRRQTLFDSMYRIEQIRPKDARRMWRQLLGHADLTALSLHGTSVKAAIRMADAILENLPSRQLTNLDTKKLGKDLNMGQRNVKNLIDKVFTHQRPGANQDLNFPLKGENVNFYLCALLPRDPEQRWIVTPEIGSIGVFESVLDLARQAGKVDKRNIDQEIGQNYLESFLIQQLEKHGVTAKSGIYYVRQQNKATEKGECDIVIESDDTICFLEVKKKPLSRNAKFGNDSALILDLAGAFLDAQAQCMRHELFLKASGRLQLSRNGATALVEYQNRRVERIAVSMLDFGSLHDRAILRQFLNACLQLKFDTADPTLTKKYEEFNQSLQKFRHLAQQLGENPADARSFISAWFLSVPQILLILDKVANNNDFAKLFALMRNVVTEHFDFYSDYARLVLDTAAQHD